MNKSEQSEPSELKDLIEESAIVRFIADHGKELLVCLIIGILLIIAMTKYFGGSNGESAYLNAEKEMRNLNHAVYTAEGIDGSIEQFASLLNNNPGLQSKYDSTVAQMLIGIGKESEAMPIAKRALKRSSDPALKTYHDFAEITLLIEQGEIAQSLEKSKELKKQINDDSNLSFYNLFRIAILEGQLDNRKEELATWQELQSRLNESDRAENFIALFSEGDITLMDFIQKRLGEP